MARPRRSGIGLLLPMMSMVGSASAPQISSAQVVDDVNWVKLAADSIYDYHIHVPTAVRRRTLLGGEIVEITSLSYLSRHVDAERRDLMEQRTQARLPVSGYENYLYSMQVWELKCADQQVSMKASTDFDRAKEQLSNYTYQREWLALEQSEAWSPVPEIFRWGCANARRQER